MWTLYNTAKTWGCRPSQLLGIVDAYDAYCLDEAVAFFGNVISNELESLETKSKNPKALEGKRDIWLKKRLGVEPSYRSPVATKR